MAFYTYLWLRYDGIPWYAGKGTGLRAFRKGCPSPDHIILQEHPTEQDAFEAEQFLVSYYGRIDLGTGCLRNLSDGGIGGSTGYKHGPRSLKWRQQKGEECKRTKPHLGHSHSEETRRILSEKGKGTQNALGHKVSEEARKLMGLQNIGNSYRKGTKHTEETKAKMKAAWIRRRETRHVAR
jgi:hypothetical protein